MSTDTGSQIRNTAVYLGTVVSAQVASFALLPLITRFLDPDAYGEYALALAVAGLVGTVASSWLRNVALRYYYEAQAASATRTFYLSLALLQLVTVVIAFSVTLVIMALLGQEIVPFKTLIAALAMILAADFQALVLTFVRAEQMSGRFAAAEITAALTRLLGTGAGLLVGIREPAFLLAAAALASVIGGLVAYKGLAPRLSGPARISTAPMKSVGRHIVGALPFSIGEWIGNLSDRLVLNAFSTTAVVGIYSAGFGLGDRVIGGLISAVSLMAWPDILESWTRGGYEKARVAVKRYFQIFIWLTTGPVVALVAFGPAVVSLLGPSYAAASEIIGFVACAAWLKGLSSGFNRHFELQKRYYALSSITLAGALANLGLNLLLIPQYAALGAAISALTARALVAMVYVFIRDKQLVSFPLRDALYCSVVCVGGVLLTRALLGSSILAVLVFAGLYALVMGVVWGSRLGALKLPRRVP